MENKLANHGLSMVEEKSLRGRIMLGVSISSTDRLSDLLDITSIWKDQSYEYTSSTNSFHLVHEGLPFGLYDSISIIYEKHDDYSPKI